MIRISLGQSVFQFDRRRQFRNIAAVVNRYQEIGTGGRQHVGELRPQRPVVDDGPRSQVLQQFGDLARRVVVVDVGRDGSGLQTPDHHVGIEIVVHDERNAILAAFPVLELIALTVSAETVAGQEVGQPARSVCRLTEGAPATAADRHQPVGNGLSDGVQNRADGPFTHGLAATPTL